jgi:hypothetical protein
VRRELKIAPPWPKLTPVGLCLAGKLELLSEKTNAHSESIFSVAFSPDGTKIVSGSYGISIKVWDSSARRPQIAPPWPKLMLLACMAGALGLLSEKTNAHRDTIRSVAFSPDGTKIVSGSDDETIKVWDSSARAEPSNRPSLAKTDACLTPAGLSRRRAGAVE